MTMFPEGSCLPGTGGDGTSSVAQRQTAGLGRWLSARLGTGSFKSPHPSPTGNLRRGDFELSWVLDFLHVQEKGWEATALMRVPRGELLGGEWNEPVRSGLLCRSGPTPVRPSLQAAFMGKAPLSFVPLCLHSFAHLFIPSFINSTNTC